jgi:uncharacterized protein YggT (Ycf19 family)
MEIWTLFRENFDNFSSYVLTSEVLQLSKDIFNSFIAKCMEMLTLFRENFDNFPSYVLTSEVLRLSKDIFNSFIAKLIEMLTLLRENFDNFSSYIKFIYRDTNFQDVKDEFLVELLQYSWYSIHLYILAGEFRMMSFWFLGFNPYAEPLASLCRCTRPIWLIGKRWYPRFFNLQIAPIINLSILNFLADEMEKMFDISVKIKLKNHLDSMLAYGKIDEESYRLLKDPHVAERIYSQLHNFHL